MNRRARALTLIALLAGGTTARPAVLSSALRAEAEACRAEPQRLEALCAALREQGLVVRVVGSRRVEITGTDRAALRLAMEAFRRAAEAQGIQFRFRSAEQEPLSALARGPEQARRVDGVAAQASPVASIAPRARDEARAEALLRAHQAPRCLALPALPALAVRAPPA